MGRVAAKARQAVLDSLRGVVALAAGLTFLRLAIPASERAGPSGGEAGRRAASKFSGPPAL